MYKSTQHSTNDNQISIGVFSLDTDELWNPMCVSMTRKIGFPLSHIKAVAASWLAKSRPRGREDLNRIGACLCFWNCSHALEMSLTVSHTISLSCQGLLRFRSWKRFSEERCEKWRCTCSSSTEVTFKNIFIFIPYSDAYSWWYVSEHIVQILGKYSELFEIAESNE